MLNLTNHQPHTNKIYLYAKDPYEAKYQLLINKKESSELKQLNYSKAFIEYSNDMDDNNKNTEEKIQIKKRKILIVYDDIIADMVCNKKLNPIVTELIIRETKVNISLVFYHIILFCCPKKYQTKFNKPFCYENSKQKRVLTNRP